MVGYLYDYLDKVYQDQSDEKGNYKQKDKPININLDIVGFSRGAASARMFASKVQKIMSDGKWYAYRQEYLGGAGKSAQPREWKYTTSALKNCGINFNFNFMGLWDTVPAYGLAQNNDISDSQAFGMNLDISNSKFKTIVHAVAMNENRYQFSRRSIYTGESQANSNNGVEQSDGKYRLEKGFLGAHSDIGGGYKEGDLSNASLMWMIKQAKEKGNISLNEQMIVDKKYNQINNPIVHDSVMALPVPVARLAYTAGSEFRWASDGSYGYDDFSIFKNRSHLSLNWEDTKAFQNPNYKKFDKVQEITESYMKDPIANHAIYPGMVLDPMVYDRHEEYGDLKGGDLKGVGDVLIANTDDKRIDIQNYLYWLHCSYGLNLTSDEPNEKNPNLTKEQLCSDNPLQTYLKK